MAIFWSAKIINNCKPGEGFAQFGEFGVMILGRLLRARSRASIKRKLATNLSIAFLLTLLSVPLNAPEAEAATVGSGNCVQDVGTSTGVTVTSVGSDCIVSFTATGSNTWTVPNGVTSVRALVVGGGGGGGAWVGGGGGGGGFRDVSAVSVTPGASISLAVGAGGNPASVVSTSYSSFGTNGADSSFGSITSTGGGRGASHSPTGAAEALANSGGSGGGATGSNTNDTTAWRSLRTGANGNTPATSPAQGFKGGNGFFGSVWVAGGGGGAGGAGADGTSTAGGAGGIGASSNITGTSLFYAGGGGGIVYNSTTGAGSGGSGGGGAGTANGTGVSGTANTGGGGGGGGSNTSQTSTGGSGGSGVVIIRYTTATQSAGTGNCSQTYTSTGLGSVSVTEANGFCYIAFRNTGSVNSQTTFGLTKPANVNTIDYLVVAGGGGGAVRHGGGGGAGGLLKGTLSVSSLTAISAVVGAGGAGGVPPSGLNYGPGTSGQDSSLQSVVAKGGGAGNTGGSSGDTGLTGGSGGGALAVNAGGSGTSGQGSNGAGGIGGVSPYSAGGGGGAGGVGTAGSGSSGGAGGAGAIWDSSFTTTIAQSLGWASSSPQFSGNQVFFAGGGGGGVAGGTGGLGSAGGGAGSGNANGTSATAASGSGGGGSGCCFTNPSGGDGGSGVVIIRYAIPPVITFNANDGSGSPSTTSQTVPSGVSTVLNSNIFTRTGYVFSGWTANADGTGPTYVDGASISITTSTTLYAKWIALETQDSYLTFSGTTSQYASVNSIIPTTGDFTFESWIRPAPGAPANSVIISQGSAGTGNHFYATRTPSNGYVGFFRLGMTAGYTNCPIYVPEDAWTHVAITFSGSTATCYINGISVFSTSNAPTTSAIGTSFYVGNWASDLNNSSVPWKGGLDEVRIYNSARTTSEILTDLRTYGPTNTSSLIAYYDFNEGSGSKILNKKNAASSTTNLNLSGSPTFADVAIATSNGNRTVVTFPRTYLNNAGGWTIPSSVSSLDYLVVGGGGGGGSVSNSFNAGGGGGGRVIQANGANVSSGSVSSVVVGTSGAAGGTTQGTEAGGIGGSSRFGALSIEAAGGGGGTGGFGFNSGVICTQPTAGGYNGGGGGSHASATTCISGNSGSGGFIGGTAVGNSTDATLQRGGGGAGAGANGISGSTSGAGGIGVASSITGSSAYYGGGGGGGTRYMTSAGSGGQGGGGAGGKNAIGTSGGVNTGGGGGGAGGDGGAKSGGFGGSGVVIVSYVSSYTITLNKGTNGTGSNQTLTKTPGTSLTLPNSATANSYFSRTGYTVTGWTTSDGGSQTYALGGTYSTDSAATLYPVWTANTYTITLNKGSNGSGSDQALTKTHDVNLTLPNSATANTYFTRTGYTVTGWATSDGGSQTYALGGTYSTESATTLYPVWTANSYTVTYNSNGGSSVTAGSFTTGGSISVAPTAPTRTGYTFVGWSATDGGSAITFPYSPGVTTNITLYAKWTFSATPVFSYNASDINSYESTSTTITDLSGNSIDAVGYRSLAFDASTYSWTFAGGGISNTSGAYVDIEDISSTQFVNASGLTIDIEADFGSSADNYERIFDLGVGGPNYGNVALGRSATSSDLELRLYQNQSTASLRYYCKSTSAITPGMHRWTVTIDGSSCRMFRNGTSLTTSVTTNVGSLPASGMTWNVNWLGRSYFGGDDAFEGKIRSARLYAGSFTPTDIQAFSYKTITYDANGGSTTPNSATTSGALRLPAAPTRTGYTFQGWYDGANYLTANKLGNASSSYSPSSSATIFAGWATGTYTITYAYNSATGGNSTTTSSFATGGTAITLPTPTRTGYTFAGWFEDSGFAGSALGSTYSPTQSRTIYAKWTADTYTVTYAYNNATGGNSTTTSSFTTGSSAITLPTPTRTGYTFAGWFEDSGFAGSALGSTYSPTQSRTIYAKWTANTYTFTFDSNSGTSVTGGTFTTGSTITKPADPTRPGKYFGGWSTSEVSNQGEVSNRISSWPYTPGSTDLTLYAIWFDDQSLTLAGTQAASVRVNASGLIPATTSFTWEAWIYPTGFAGTGSTKWATVLDNGDDGNNYGRSWLYVMDRGSGPFISAGYLTTNMSGQNIETAANTISLNTWQHVAVTYSRTGSSLVTTVYVNGVSVGSGTVSVPVSEGLNSLGFLIGDNVDDLNQQFKGSIDQVKVWDGILTAAEVAATRVTYSSTGVDNTLRAHYDFNDLSALPVLGNTVDNIASNANTYDLSVFAASSANVTANVSRSLNSFTVTYSGNNASSGFVQSESGVLPYSTVTIPSASALSRTGYSFSSWNTSSGGTGTNYSAGDSYQVLYGDQTIFAKWTAGTNTVTFKSNYTGGPSDTTQSITSGSATALTSNTFSRTGYTFAGWTTNADGTGTSYTNGQSITINSALTLHAKWTANSNTVTFKSNYTGGPSDTTQSITTDASTALTSNTFSRTGYTFAGWTTNADGTGTSYTNGQSITINSALTLHAKWTANSNTVTFKSNYTGGPSDTTQSITTDATTALTSNTFTRTGYTFAGWATNADGTGTSYTNGQSVTINSALTLFAKWTAGTNTVTFKSNYTGGPSDTTQSITSGSATALTSNTFTRTGYTFAGWTTNADGTGTSYTNAQSVTINSALTLFAKWTEVNYTITYNVNGASGTPEKSTEVYGISTGALTLPSAGSMTYAGYRFDGWAESAGGTKLTSPYTPTSTRTLYARWIAASYAITYFDTSKTSGSAPSATSFTTGGSAVIVAGAGTLARSGYTFAGWNTKIDGTGTTYAQNDSLTTSAPVNLYPRWTAVNYTVTYSTTNSTSGSAPTDALTYIIGDAITVKGNSGTLARTGYSFAGWTDNSSGTGTVYQSGETYTVSTSNVTFYPKWTANTYNITYNTNGATGTPARTSDTYTTGDPAVTLPGRGTMAKTGYTFTGWSTSPTGIGQTSATTTSDVTLYAIWDLNRYSISFNRGRLEAIDLSGSQVATFPANTQADFRSSITLGSAPTNVSSNVTVNSRLYQFFGWSDGNTIYNPGQTYQVGDSAPTFTAQWIRLYEVRYALNGGTGIVDIDSECTQSGNTCLANQSITLSQEPTREGHTFTGWKDQSNATFSAGASTTVTDSSFVYYAQWSPIPYSISFNSVGGSQNPVAQTKTIGQTVTLPDPGTRSGYDFSGWTVGGVTYGVGTNYTVGASNAVFTALWTAKRYNVSYDWNGGVGTPTSSTVFTHGNAAITLPTGSAHTKDGYVFDGWAVRINGTLENNGAAVGLTHTPTSDVQYVARWIDGAYTITYDARGGSGIAASASVNRTTSTTLPTPTRANYSFEGWYEDSATTVLYGAAGASKTPIESKTIYAKWVQDSLYGINPAHLNSLTSITVTGSHTWSGTHTASGTGASLSIPAGALPNNTVVQVSFVEDLTRPKDLINQNYAYYTSVVLHWQLGSGSSATVPVAASGKPLELTLTNPDIRAGAKIYKIIKGTATHVATATQDGQITIEVSEDPEIVVAAAAPTAPRAVGALGNQNAQSTVSWTAPLSSGGAAVTSYTVTSSPGNKTCTATGTTSCTVTGLTNDTSYTFTVVANNAVGSSSSSAASSAIIPRLRPTYTATFDSKGGSSVSGTLFNNTDGIAAPTTPTRSGFNFGGWLTTDGDSSTIVTFPYSPGLNSDVTLFAYWISTSQNSSGGSSSSSASSNLPSNSSPSTQSGSTSAQSNSAGTRPNSNVPQGPIEYIAPQSSFPELKDAPYPTNGFNVPAVGQFIGLIEGKPIEVVVKPQETQTVIEFGSDVAITLISQGTTGDPIEVGPNGSLTVIQGAFIQAQGNGFKSNSPVEAWLHSEPIRLGSGFANAAGEFENKFTISTEIPLGEHTLVLNGLTGEGEIVTLALGIEVKPISNVEQLPQDPSDNPGLLESLPAFLWLMLLAFLAGIGYLAYRRRHA